MKTHPTLTGYTKDIIWINLYQAIFFESNTIIINSTFMYH